MEKKEATAATVLTGADNNTRILALSGGELVQMPFTAIPEATTETRGLMGAIDKRSNPSSSRLLRYIYSPSINSQKAFRIRLNEGKVIGSMTLKVYGSWVYGAAMGCVRKVNGFNYVGENKMTVTENSVYECSRATANIFYITDPFIQNNQICVDIINKYPEGVNGCLVILESYNNEVTVSENQSPLAANLTRSNLDETAYAFKTTISSLSADIQSFTPPPRKFRANKLVIRRLYRGICEYGHAG